MKEDGKSFVGCPAPELRQGMKLRESKCGDDDDDQKDINSGFKKEGSTKILSFFDLLATGLGSTLGVGVSVLIGEIIKNDAGPAIVVSVFVAGVTALLGGLCFAEFGARFLNVDSSYAYSYFWCKESIAFIFGWVLVLEFVAGTASVATGTVAFLDALAEGKISELLKKTAPTNLKDVFPYFDYISFTIIIITVIFTSFKLKDSIVVKKIFTLCNLLLVISVIIAGIFKADVKNWSTESNSGESQKSGFAPFGAQGVIKGAAVAFYGFIGFETICVAGSEIKKRKRNLPIAILATILVTLVSFAGIGIILTLMMPYSELCLHAAVPFAFQQVGWVEFKWVVGVTTFLGFQTSILGASYPFFRIINGMANDGLLFCCLGDKRFEFKAPVKASVSGGLIAALAAGILPFQKLVNLTIIAALFVHSIMAINVILFRYSEKPIEKKQLESGDVLINNNEVVTAGAMMRNYFNFKRKKPTILTQKIILANIILFCVSSIGLSVVLNYFYDTLISRTVEVITITVILLCVMLFSLISMNCQPKSQDVVPFKVPLLPLMPCLSIFLNIFLMLTFESLTWIFFFSWVAIGLLPHFIWRYFRCLRGNVSENSKYEINRINAVKLNESIWKIKSDKKSFYEGTVNLAFCDDFDDDLNEVKNDTKFEAWINSDKTLPLKQAEILQTSESIVEEKTIPLEHKTKPKIIHVNSAEILNVVSDEEEKVQWECVAEIHTGDEFDQENVALEIVDNTYNFLSEVTEELLKDDSFRKEAQEEAVLEEDKLETVENSVNVTGGLENNEESFHLNKHLLRQTEKFNEEIENNLLVFRENELKVKNQSNEETEAENRHSNHNGDHNQALQVNKEKNSDTYFSNDIQSEKSEIGNSNSPFSNLSQEEELFVNLIVTTVYEAHKSEMISNQNNTITVIDSDAKTTKTNSDEQNKRKEFKEKLNQLLKSQMNNDVALIKNSSTSKILLNETEIKDEKSKDELYKTIKALNKSQIRGKLELLLAKGPPKRLSVENSFNLKFKEQEKENDSNKTDSGVTKDYSINAIDDRGGEKNSVKTSTTLTNSIKEKILSLKKVDKESNDDACC